MAPPQEEEEEEFYKVEAFLARHSHKVLVQWENGDKTWEPEKNLRQDLGQETYDRMVKLCSESKQKPTKKKARTMEAPTKKKKKKCTPKTPVFPTKKHSATCFKPVINQAIAELAKKYKAKTVLVVDDPSSKTPMQTTQTLRKHIPDIHITAISKNTKIKKFRKDFDYHGDKLVCQMTTRFLEAQLRLEVQPKYDMVFLDYCDTPARTNKKYDWLEDVQILMDDLLAPGGMVHMTFSSRSFGHVHTFVRFMLEYFAPNARIVAPYDYRDTQNMVVFTMVRKGDWSSSHVPLSIGHVIIPKPDEEVLVQTDDDKPWVGRFVGMLTSKVCTVYYPPENKYYENLDTDIVRRVNMTV